MSDIVIHAAGLTKNFGSRRVLDRVDLSLRRGRVTAVLGPSGAGKSTLLRTIAGLERVDSGTVESGGLMLTDGEVRIPPERRNIGLVFQDFALFPHLTVLENVMFGLRSGSRAERRSRAMEMLDLVRLANRTGAYPHALSGGEQQRIALARALAPAPQTVLLDEAFSGLDVWLRAELRETALTAISAVDAATLMVTHDAQEAMYMADDLALMIDGRIVQSGSPSRVYSHPVSAQAAHLLGDINEWHGQVRGGQVATPFGSVKNSLENEGRDVVVLVRPADITITKNPLGRFEIQDVRLLGDYTAVSFRITESNSWTAQIRGAGDLRIGQPIDLYTEPARITVLLA